MIRVWCFLDMPVCIFEGIFQEVCQNNIFWKLMVVCILEGVFQEVYPGTRLCAMRWFTSASVVRVHYTVSRENCQHSLPVGPLGRIKIDSIKKATGHYTVSR